MDDIRIQKFNGANMDIDLATPGNMISWEQDRCPWNKADKTGEHRCAIKNESLCHYFCGVEYLDTILCCYPHPNPMKRAGNSTG